MRSSNRRHLPQANHRLRVHVAKPRFVVRQICIGCGCTDDRACPGGCSWSEPGICSRCADRTSELLMGSKIAQAIFSDCWGKFRAARARGFAIPSMVVLGFFGARQLAERHEEMRAKGWTLKPVTRVAFNRHTWSFALTYSVANGSGGSSTETTRYNLRYAASKAGGAST